MPRNIDIKEVVLGYGTFQIFDNCVHKMEKVNGKYLVDIQVTSTTMPPIGTKFLYLGYTWQIEDIEYIKATPDSFTQLTLEVELIKNE